VGSGAASPQGNSCCDKPSGKLARRPSIVRQRHATVVPRDRSPSTGQIFGATRRGSLCRLWQQQGKIEEARQLLAPIYDWFTEGVDTADVQEAGALLRELA
jgi:predicted ATPase